jgi:RNA polymerase sigma factor (sigma-70 family)
LIFFISWHEYSYNLFKKMWCAGFVIFIYNHKDHGKSALKFVIEVNLIDRQKKILQLFDASGPRLHRLLGRLTLREDEAGDLLQELFLRLWNSRSFDRTKYPFSYAYRAAINLAFEWRRDRKLSSRPLGDDCPAKIGSSALGKMIAAEELGQILDATMQLTDLACDVVVMHYIEQESYDQIAKRLGKKPQYLRALNAKAVVRLREILIKENQ